MKNLKFGLVGCGRISSKHFEAIQQIDKAEIVACADIIEERAQNAAEKFNIHSFYTDYSEMLENEKLDAILICTPSGMHPKMGIEAARRKINVITEKPMAIDLKSADALVQACDENKVELFVVKQNRLNPAIQVLKKAVDKGRFGRIFSANATVRWTRPQAYYDMAKWRGTWEFDGGAFMNQASHYFDLIQWLMGPVESVMAFTATLNHNIEAEDMGSGIIHFRSGGIGTVEVTMNIFPKNYEGSITLMGENGTVKIGGVAVNKVENWQFKDYDDDDKIIETANTNPTNIYGFGHLGYLQNVVDVLHGKDTPNTDGRSGRKSLELILAMYESAKTGKKIALPLSV
ncbi:MAG: Gfo/Idh/MocA family oxidoreductase [Candidatus Cloacimonetes bacterium]|nr:Gfo/Idh/MocA family oxidoreductase [Candidatus Cloacimonadota bacterium]MCF7814508.1 Gfo/Idh/MocA family oxidoreductase [Candidatus Cloacimonadota bacterium]MCF7869057.1 Gfo/Idh/MocA family oxidoreductase [Candidatus Cloacimonadota bacterium]MCF7884452.1 Gfo/Idh/MocA family oxidoreductase [Candidatus Cloacimonadota bacterium]